ncbi:hypothetical protein [Maridesulfovibrio frigidus]|uniref:hypothetical protein n=1 Tax=Maridesulfovibrio frigidus TaxID=340956 RepID=UPI000B192DCB|nr:hypothetical protein [Maridesulfovibrio frigidus]
MFCNLPMVMLQNKPTFGVVRILNLASLNKFQILIVNILTLTKTYSASEKTLAKLTVLVRLTASAMI